MRAISDKEHLRFIKALRFLTNDLRKKNKDDLSGILDKYDVELNKIYSEYIEKVSDRYHTTFQGAREEYITDSRINKRMTTLECRKKTDVA